MGRDPWADMPVPSDIAARGRLWQGSPTGRAMPGTSLVPFPGAATAPGAPPAEIPPYLIRPPSANDITVNASAPGFNAANTPAVIPGSVFQLPADNVGILRSVVLSINTLLATSAVLWRFRFDGTPVQGWSQLTIFPRAVATISVAYGPDETFIFVPTAALIDVEFIVADANTYQAGVTYHGWYYDRALAGAGI